MRRIIKKKYIFEDLYPSTQLVTPPAFTDPVSLGSQPTTQHTGASFGSLHPGSLRRSGNRACRLGKGAMSWNSFITPFSILLRITLFLSLPSFSFLHLLRNPPATFLFSSLCRWVFSSELSDDVLKLVRGSGVWDCRG